MPGPPPGRELPGLVLKDRGALFNKLNQKDRRNIMFNNRFGILANSGDDTGNDGSTRDTREVKVKKPPPIETLNKKLNEIIEIIKTCKNLTCASAIQYRLSVTKIDNKMRETVKIYTENSSDFNVLQKHLDQVNVEYSTHPLHGDKKLKICLYGLYDMQPDLIKSEIKKLFTIEPCDIKKIKPKNEYSGDSRIHILYFKKSDKVRVADLREKITGLFNMRVRFEYYSPRKYGPTQCTNCQDYGHGSENCHRIPKCVRCGGNHSSKSCIHLSTPDPTSADKPKINNDLVKCANCGGKHTANYSKCSYRANLLKKQENFKKPSKSIGYKFNLNDFPALNPNIEVTNTSNTNSIWQKYPAPPPLESTLEAMQRFLDSQNQMATMMNQMMTQMCTILSTMNQMLEKMNNLNNGQK